MSSQSPRPRLPHVHKLGEVAHLSQAAAILGNGSETDICGLTAASSQVRPGDLFVALAGARTHGAAFCAAARDAGAVAVLTDPVGAELVGPGLPVVVCDQPRQRLGALAAWFYGRPMESLRTAAVTGTNGKTTTAYLVREIWRRCAVPAGVLGTIGLSMDGADIPAVLTTPEAPELQSLAAVLVESGAQGLAMEVSSHALVTGRVDGVCFDVAGFTNLTQDHLDFHPTMRDYFEAKALLFTPERSRTAVVCVDDTWGAELAARQLVPTARFSAQGNAAEYVCHIGPGAAVRLETPAGELFFDVGLPGQFNQINAAMAMAMVHAAGMPISTLRHAVQAGAVAPRVPGRMETIEAGGGGPLVIVDFAHNPGALRAALQAAREAAVWRVSHGAEGHLPTPRVHVVFGATGERDVVKRPLMGAVAGEMADVVWLTDDDPHGEDRASIRAEVRRGVAAKVRVVEVAERREAIHAAIADAAAWDVVLVAGRGHETVQEIMGVDVPLDDAAEARSALAGWKGREA